MTQAKKSSEKAPSESPSEEKAAAPKKEEEEKKHAFHLGGTISTVKVGQTQTLGAPRLETPEKKSELSLKELPRDEEPKSETPEEKPEPLKREEPEHQKSLEIASSAATETVVPNVVPEKVEFRETTMRTMIFAAKPPKPSPQTPVSSDVLELYNHVASNPVDSHAPAWTPHVPNSP
jgi:hypothetical protein